MSSTPIAPGSSDPTPPATPVVPAQPSSVDRLLSILDIGLKALGAATGGPLGAGLNIADLMLQLGAHAKTVYEKETGQPYDLNKIPFEDHVS